MKLRVVSVDKDAERAPASNLSAQEFLDDARDRFPNPSEFMREFLRRFEELATGEKFEPADHAFDCPQCGAQLTLEVDEK